jgi:hypothetical protein
MAGEKSSSTTSNAFSLILQALQTAASIGILVVLAMLLIQFKKFSDPDYMFPVSIDPDYMFSVSISGISYSSPFFVQTVPAAF